MLVNESGGILHYEDYDPFGLQMPGRSMVSGAPKERFTGHELDEETGLYYAGARYLDPVIGRWTSVDPLAAKYPAWSPYNYALNNPLLLVDPTGRSAVPPDDYYNRQGRYLGSDGAATTNARMINGDTFNQISTANGGTTSAAATEALQANSQIITIDEAKIQQDVQSVRDMSLTTGVEHSAYITLDPQTATVTSGPGPVGDNASVVVESFSHEGVSYAAGDAYKGQIKVLLGQVHGHPKVQTPGYVNGPGTSLADKYTAMSVGITVYAVEAWRGKPGGSSSIHRVTPLGVQTNNVGKTGAFNFGRDALEITGGKR